MTLRITSRRVAALRSTTLRFTAWHSAPHHNATGLFLSFTPRHAARRAIAHRTAPLHNTTPMTVISRPQSLTPGNRCSATGRASPSLFSPLKKEMNP